MRALRTNSGHNQRLQGTTKGSDTRLNFSKTRLEAPRYEWRLQEGIGGFRKGLEATKQLKASRQDWRFRNTTGDFRTLLETTPGYYWRLLQDTTEGYRTLLEGFEND